MREVVSPDRHWGYRTSAAATKQPFEYRSGRASASATRASARLSPRRVARARESRPAMASAITTPDAPASTTRGRRTSQG